MSIAARSSYQLIDGLLEEGLGFVVSYLEKSIRRSIIIVDHNGLIHYPILPINSAGIDNVFIQLPSSHNDLDYYYQEAEKYLSYPVEYNGKTAYIIVKNLPIKMLASTLAILIEAKLAIKCYFSNLNKSGKNAETFARKLGEYLFLPSNENLADIIKLSDADLNLQAAYYVAITEVDEVRCDIDWQSICAYSRDHQKRDQLEFIPLAWSNCLIAIIPARNINDSLETDTDCPRLLKHKESMESAFKLIFSQGIGQPYPLIDIKKSFHEARIALTLPRLMGGNNFSQQFSKLGIASLIFSQDSEMLKSFCYKTLGKLMDYDKSNHCELLSTLRQLLDNSMNWKLTADRLFIHINTLYYRVNKIEKLLNLDLSRMETRVNLYMAIKIWDTLTLNNTVD